MVAFVWTTSRKQPGYNIQSPILSDQFTLSKYPHLKVAVRKNAVTNQRTIMTLGDISDSNQSNAFYGLTSVLYTNLQLELMKLSTFPGFVEWNQIPKAQGKSG